MAVKPFCMLRRTVIAEAPRLRVSEYALAPDDRFPLHSHSSVREVFYCLEGTFSLLLRDPDEEVRLGPGGSAVVEPGRPHAPRCGGAAQCRYLIVQSGEGYDFNPLEEA